jgi:hypothetical protein
MHLSPGDRMKRSVAVAFAVVLVSFLGCKKSQPEGDALAVVNDAVLTLQDFHSEIPPEYVTGLTPDQKMGFVDRWINTELLYQEALKRGIDREGPVAVRLAQVRRELLANEMLQREMAVNTSVSEEEVRRYFTEHESEFNTEIKIAHILLASPDTAEVVLAKLREGADFAELAKRYSLDQSGQTGGVSEYFRRGDMASVSELEDAAFALEKPGELSPIVATEYGYHIIKLVARRKLATPVKVEEVSDHIRDSLLMTKQRIAFEQMISDLRAKAKVEVHPELLARTSPAPYERPEENR